MKIINSLTQCKEIVKDVRDQAVIELSSDLLPELNRLLDKVQDSINDAAGWVEKTLQDRLVERKMELELESQINSNPLYRDLDQDTRGKIVGVIISDPSKMLLKDEDFKEFLNQELNKLPNDKLILKAYTKDEIIRLGKSTTPEGSVGEQYQAGLRTLQGTLDTSSGLDDAIAWGIKRIMGDPKARKQYLLSYYGLGNV